MDLDTFEKQVETRYMMLNMGPSHPAMHGVIRIKLVLDGETVINADVEIGYLHRAFEKSCEQVSYNKCMPYTDRLNYVSPLINNFGFCNAVERLLGLEITERCKYIRVIMSEISRITDHLTCVGASAMELGAFTVFLYMIKAREYLYDLVEMVTGARLTVSYGRIGGVKADLPENFEKRTKDVLKQVRCVLKEVDALLSRNRIFVDRMKNVGCISQEDAISYGITGPFLRSTGVGYDLRKMNPYWVYDQMDFIVPVGEVGDNLDRYYVRMEEMQQSMRIVEQAMEQMPSGETNISETVLTASEMVDEAKIGNISKIQGVRLLDLDPTLLGATKKYHKDIYPDQKGVALPAKENTYGNIEGLMNHFKLVMNGHGINPPKGEVYDAVEGANGELGFYIVSDGTDKPYRVRVRPPCFPIMAALAKIIKGGKVADVVATFGSVNMIAGELDR